MFIARLCAAFDQQKVTYAVVGGYAVALHGVVRGTVDIDIVVRWNKRNLKAAEKALTGLGLVSRIPVSADDIFQFRDEYINSRNLIAWSFYHPERANEVVDLIIDFDLGRKSVESVEIEAVQVRYLNMKDLIAMKRASGRKQDLEDIAALESLS